VCILVSERECVCQIERVRERKRDREEVQDASCSMRHLAAAAVVLRIKRDFK
jgi:hypothetical protein